MSVSRMKNLIILVLSICAACLLAVAVPNRLSQTHEPVSYTHLPSRGGFGLAHSHGFPYEGELSPKATERLPQI